MMRRTGKTLGLLLAMAGGLVAQTALASASTMRVAAIVNDEVISAYDLEQRIKLIVSTSGISPNADMLSRIEPQVLRTLVEERLQLQEAAKQEITVEDAEVEQAFANIAQQNGMSADQIQRFLSQSNIGVATLKDQIRAEIAWNKLVNARFGPRIFVSEEEVSAEHGRMMESLTQPQYLVAEVFLGVDGPDQDEEIRRTALRLLEEMQQGAPFASIAQQFSESATAASGGDLGWVQPGQLDPALDRAIETMLPGQVSVPIRTAGGYHVLFLRNKRDGQGGEGASLKRVTLKQIVTPLPERAGKGAVDAATAKMRGAATRLAGCGSVERVAAQDGALIASDLGTLTMQQIAPFFRNAVLMLAPGQASEPIRGPTGVHVLVVCDREMGEAQQIAMPTNTDIENRLYNQQLSMVSRRYLRDLRRDAVIEYR